MSSLEPLRGLSLGDLELAYAGIKQDGREVALPPTPGMKQACGA